MSDPSHLIPLDGVQLLALHVVDAVEARHLSQNNLTTWTNICLCLIVCKYFFCSPAPAPPSRACGHRRRALNKKNDLCQSQINVYNIPTQKACQETKKIQDPHVYFHRKFNCQRIMLACSASKEVSQGTGPSQSGQSWDPGPIWARPASEPLIPRPASSGTIIVTRPLIGLNQRQASDSASMAAVFRSFEDFNSITTWVGVSTFYFFLSTGWQKTVSLYFRTPLSLTLIDHCSARSRSLSSRNYRRAKYNKHCENNNTHLLQSDRRIWDAFVKSSQWVRIRSFETSAILMIIKIRKIWLNYKSVVDSE